MKRYKVVRHSPYLEPKVIKKFLTFEEAEELALRCNNKKEILGTFSVEIQPLSETLDIKKLKAFYEKIFN